MAFRDKTTFVVGAGASQEFGFPVGTGLAAEIKKSGLTAAFRLAPKLVRHRPLPRFIERCR